MLVGRAEPGVERDDLEPVAPEGFERVGGVADLGAGLGRKTSTSPVSASSSRTASTIASVWSRWTGSPSSSSSGLDQGR